MIQCCLTKRLPDELHVEAAFKAAIVRPSNVAVAPATEGGAVAIAPQSMAMLRGKFWRNGQVLRVAFMAGSRAVRDRVMSHAAAWSEYANLDFVEVPIGAEHDIRVGFDRPGYYSYLGTDALSVPLSEPTLNLQGFDDESRPPPEREWRRVVRHEFGHAIGALHEQQRPEQVARLDREKVYAKFEREQGWSREMIDAQVLESFDLADTEETPEADDRSIMEYFISGDCTVDGLPIEGGLDIDEKDKQLASEVYPGRWPASPVVPIVPTSGSGPLEIGGPTCNVSISAGGSVTLALTVPRAGMLALAAVVQLPYGRDAFDVSIVSGVGQGAPVTPLPLTDGFALLSISEAGTYGVVLTALPTVTVAAFASVRAWWPEVEQAMRAIRGELPILFVPMPWSEGMP
jgi:hypothetical protein